MAKKRKSRQSQKRTDTPSQKPTSPKPPTPKPPTPKANMPKDETTTTPSEPFVTQFSTIEPALSSSTMDAIQTLGFRSMTPVQSVAIPRFLSNQDVAVEAITGSGKTLSFVIPIFEILLRKEVEYAARKLTQWGAIVLSPTRELAKQINKVACVFSAHCKLNTMLLIGGTSISDDLARLRSAQQASVASDCSEARRNRLRNDVIIGTPGRVDDIITRGVADSIVDLRELEVLVMDEADVLLNMGFQDQINNILNRLPKQRRTGLFSATQTREVKALIRAGLRNPATISVKVSHAPQHGESTGDVCRTPTTLNNFYTVCPIEEKFHRLIHFLLTSRGKKLIVFFATCACVEFFGKLLQEFDEFGASPEGDLPAVEFHVLHGKMVTKRRTLTFEKFAKSDHGGVLLCTDVAARGIDVPDVDWIVQYDPPQDPDVFVHRVGRTARAGKSGKALIFVQPKEDSYIPFMENRDVPISNLEVPVADTYTRSPEETLAFMKKLVMEDRDVLEKGTKAFISYLRSYKEHRCRFVFRLEELDLVKVATAFVLLRLPKLTEFRDNAKAMRKFPCLPNKEIGLIAYKDKLREKQRQQTLLSNKEKQKLDDEKDERRKKERREEKIRLEKQRQQPKKRKKGKQKMLYEEWDDLASEERLYKKFKKGKITKKEYERMLKNIDSDEE